jgi:two-component system response regulator AtoC
MVQNGDFREDLHYRLNSLAIAVPPLRDRREDIPLLTRHFLEQAAARTGAPVKVVSDAVADIFQNHPWPGNVRQLENILQHAAAMTEGQIIQTNHLPNGFPGKTAGLAKGYGNNGGKPNPSDITRQDILTSLLETRWNRSLAAQRLGVARSTFYRKMDELGVS